jgi:hypothetical protein
MNMNEIFVCLQSSKQPILVIQGSEDWQAEISTSKRFKSIINIQISLFWLSPTQIPRNMALSVTVVFLITFFSVVVF